MQDDSQTAAPPVNRPSKTTLFAACFKIGITSFGGGLSGWMHREFVMNRRWLDDHEFISSYAMSRMLPGPNAMNLLIFVSYRMHGVIGALIAAAGFLLGPFVIVLILFQFFRNIAEQPRVALAMTGVTAAALGMLLTIVVKGVKMNISSPPTLVIIAATAVAVGIFRLPLIPVVLVVGPISVFLAYRRL